VSDFPDPTPKYFYHIAPTHYVLMILRAGALKSKNQLLEEGFNESHFRTTSFAADINRGYADVIHCTTSSVPPLLSAKLARGFPHVRFRIPIAALPEEYDLSRFNIARGRYLKNGRSPLPESPRNGRYLESYELPAARSAEDKLALLNDADLNQPGIEILLKHEFPLPDGLIIDCGSEFDANLVSGIIAELGCSHAMNLVDFTVPYTARTVHQEAVEMFLAASMEKPSWKGNGLDYDRLR
jgi:hypothetical protein